MQRLNRGRLMLEVQGHGAHLPLSIIRRCFSTKIKAKLHISLYFSLLEKKFIRLNYAIMMKMVKTINKNRLA